jgi:hypothetical protein
MERPDSNYQKRLQGGHPNSLGETVAIVEEILSDPNKKEQRMKDFFSCYFSTDEVVRLRVSNGVKRLSKEDPGLVFPFMDRFLEEIAKIPQASTQWTLAWLFGWFSDRMSHNQKTRALNIMKINLEKHQDWIVLNTTMDTLGRWAQTDPGIAQWLSPHLERLSRDERKSVAGRAKKVQKSLGFF